MKIKSMKCPSCDASLKIKPGQTEGVCEYCKTPFVIDDEVIRIEKKTTVELKLDHDFEIAMTTLENFKEYGKSEFLFRRLVRRYGHKKEVYIGLVRSITHDFTRVIADSLTMMEVNNFWEKYKSLATKKEVSVYEDSLNEMNQKHWHGKLIEKTCNFNNKECKNSLEDIEKIWEYYKHYCGEAETSKLETKYNAFLKKELEDIKRRNRVVKFGIIIFIGIILVIFLVDFLAKATESAKQTTEEINTSAIYENCSSFEKCENTEFIAVLFKDTKAELSVTKVVINKENKTLTATIKLDGRYNTKEKDYLFNIKDDMGPFISSNYCTYKDTEEFDVNKCFEAYDFTDGSVSNNNIEVETNVNFKEAGTKTITVRATDSEGHTSAKDIEIEITKTPITLSVNFVNELKVGQSATITYGFEPANIPNKQIEYSYDENYVSINNNVVTAKKKGTTSICVVSKYDNTKTCVDVKINLECQNTAIFNLNGGREETFVAGENFCAGKYKVYANVLSKDKVYSLKLETKDRDFDYITIAKYSNFVSEEGDQFYFAEGTKITSALGVTQIKLVEVG